MSEEETYRRKTELLRRALRFADEMDVEDAEKEKDKDKDKDKESNQLLR